MRPYIIIFIIFLIPAMVSLAHDISLYFNNPDHDFTFVSIGYVWTQYAQGSFEAFIKAGDQTTIAFVDQVLSWKLTLAALCFGFGVPLLVACEYFILRLLFGWIGGQSYTKEAYEQKGKTLLQRNSRRALSYTRK